MLKFLLSNRIWKWFWLFGRKFCRFLAFFQNADYNDIFYRTV